MYLGTVHRAVSIEMIQKEKERQKNKRKYPIKGMQRNHERLTLPGERVPPFHDAQQSYNLNKQIISRVGMGREGMGEEREFVHRVKRWNM